jgi:hypothetical protein
MHLAIQFDSRRMLPVLTVLAVALVVLSCSSDRHCFCEPVIPVPPDPTSPNRLLDMFACSLAARNIGVYAECLDDSYTFTFPQADWDKAGVTADRPCWGKSEDVAATANMFGCAGIKKIELDWLPPVADWELAADSIFVVDHWQSVPCFIAIFQPDIRVTEQWGDEAPVGNWVHSSRLLVTVCHDRADRHLWTILRITEIPISVLEGELSTSFGGIKARFKDTCEPPAGAPAR